MINSPLESFEGMVRRLYQPMLGGLTTKEWGRAEGEHANEFMISLDSLMQNLEEVGKAWQSSALCVCLR